jgi:ProP effector
MLHKSNGSPGAGGAAPGAKAEAAGCSPSPSRSRQQAQANETIAILCEWFPLAFFVYERRRRPLKLGIDHDIAVATAGAITVAEIRTALRFYCGNVGYLRACKPGAARVDLNGNAAGTVTPDEAVHAWKRLASRAAARRKVEPNQHKSSSASPGVPRIGFAELRAAAHARRAAALK